MQINLEGKNKLYKTKECVQELVDQILGNEKTILEINLTGNVFYIEAMDYLFDHVSKIEKLQKCILIGVLATLPKNIMLSNLKIISTKLPTKHLEVLDLSDNALSCELPEEFRTFFHSLKCLKILHLNNCGLGEKGGIWLAETLLGMKNKKSLNVIQLAQNKFIKFPKNLEVALDFHECLEEIRIQYNTIQMGDMETFISALGNLKLRVLDVRDNNLNLNSCEMLGKFYQNWEIEELYLGSCCLNDKSIHLFLKHASKKENILSLHGSFIQPTNKFIFDISNNDITQEVIDEIKEFLKDRVIDKLFIQGNEYDDCTELVNLVSKKGGKVVHDNEDDIEYEDISLIQKFEEALSKNKF